MSVISKYSSNLHSFFGLNNFKQNDININDLIPHYMK